VTAFTFDSTNNKLVLTGTDLPTAVEDIQDVIFAKSKCTVDSTTLSATNLECTLEREPTCGSYLPILNSKLGRIPNDAALVEQVVSCTITGSSPTTDLNLLGGDNITLSGTNFPHDLRTSNVVITFDDAQSTTCEPQISATGELVCLTAAFDAAASTGSSHGLVVTINGQSITNSESFAIRSSIQSSITISPNSVSPVLKTPITITLESTFAHSLVKEDFTVNATLSTNSTVVKYLRVVSVDDTAKTLLCMFGGAESGVYDITIRHSVEGIVGSSVL
jgi:hypothetical protein